MLLAGVAVARAVRDGQSGWQAVAIVLAAMPVLVLGTLKRDLYMQHRSAVISAVRVLRTVSLHACLGALSVQGCCTGQGPGESACCDVDFS